MLKLSMSFKMLKIVYEAPKGKIDIYLLFGKKVDIHIIDINTC